jgi:predicted AlkP superfamily phosphohydrolase/phosphomutase
MRTLILGFDSFDPAMFQRAHSAGKMTNLGKLVDAGGYSPLEVCSPPQTEVSWTSIATGVDPGSHGIFDFVHRDPKTYTPYVSLLPTKQSILGEQFLPPYTTKTFFQEAAEMGYPATALWWPALFPARPEIPVATIPGLGTPDIRGQLGVGTYFTTESEEKKKTKVNRLESSGKGKFTALLEGPNIKSKDGMRPVTLPVTIDVMDDTSVQLTIGEKKIALRQGEWSPIIELKFPVGFLTSVFAITKVILTELKGRISLYVMPLQIHPLHSLWQYATPATLVKDAWKNASPFLTLGWPQDTNALEDACISDDQFLKLCDSIFESRQKIYWRLLRNFREGVLAGIFDCLDRVQHMFLRDREDIVFSWYERLDTFVGQVQTGIEKLGFEKHRFLVLSDHGFRPFDQKVHLNRWLVENGYMTLTEPVSQGDLHDVDWRRTTAYGIGLNSLYLNIAGREGQGIVGADRLEQLLDELKNKLLAWQAPDGRNTISKVSLKHEVFSGPYNRIGPDLVVGYAPGFRASSETGLGKFTGNVLEKNNDHWGADHCIDPTMVPGVLFANRDLSNMPRLSFRDIPYLAIGKHLDQSYIKPPSQMGSKGQKDIEERLKGLGYL